MKKLGAPPTSQPPALRRAIDEAQRALGSDDEVQRLRAKLGQLPPVPPGGSDAAAATTTSGLAVKGLGVAAIAALIAAAIAYVSRTEEAPRPRAPATDVAASAEIIAPPAGPKTAPSPAIEVAPPEPAPAAPVSGATVVRPKPARPLPAVQAPSAPVPNAKDELALLMSAQDALDVSPQRALGLLEEHARSYPNGNFAIERESLAIDALRKLGRVTAAQERARTFVARFPNAPATKRLSRWLDESTDMDHKPKGQPLPRP